MLILEDVINIQPFRAQNFRMGHISGRNFHNIVTLRNHYQNAIHVKSLQNFRKSLCFYLIKTKPIQYHYLILFTLAAQGHLQGLLADLFVDLGSKISRLRAEGDTPAAPDRRRSGTCTSPSSPLLPPGLATATSDLRTSFGARTPGSPLGQLHDHHFVEQVGFDLDIENLVVQFDFTYLFVLAIANGHCCHDQPLFFSLPWEQLFLQKLSCC